MEPAHFFSPGLKTIPSSQILSSDTHQAIGWCRSCRRRPRRWTRTFQHAEMLTSSCQSTMVMVLQVTWDRQQGILLTLKSLRFGQKKKKNPKDLVNSIANYNLCQPLIFLRPVQVETLPSASCTIICTTHPSKASHVGHYTKTMATTGMLHLHLAGTRHAAVPFLRPGKIR